MEEELISLQAIHSLQLAVIDIGKRVSAIEQQINEMRLKNENSK